MDTYVFKVVLGDSSDEFSEEFNPKNKEEIMGLEDSIKDALEDNNWQVDLIKLESVTVKI